MEILDTVSDKFAMLLSTDWFLPYWPVIGLDTAADTKNRIQQGCRDIVKQMMENANSYWLIVFTAHRVDGTRNALLGVARDCQLDKAMFHKWERLCAARPDREQHEKTAWLFSSVGDDLLADDELDTGVAALVRGARVQNIDTEQLEAACLSSRSEWDNYIRQLTPDLPTYLPDWLSAAVLPEAEMDAILRELSAEQQAHLFTRFRAVAKSSAHLPDELLPSSW